MAKNKNGEKVRLWRPDVGEELEGVFIDVESLSSAWGFFPALCLVRADGVIYASGVNLMYQARTLKVRDLAQLGVTLHIKCVAHEVRDAATNKFLRRFELTVKTEE